MNFNHALHLSGEVCFNCTNCFLIVCFYEFASIVLLYINIMFKFDIHFFLDLLPCQLVQLNQNKMERIRKHQI